MSPFAATSRDKRMTLAIISKFIPLVFLVHAGVLAAEKDVSSATTWDRFRGPNGAGLSADKNIPLTFGDQTNMIWKIASPGAGNSSPIVWGKSLFLQSASSDGRLRTLLCVDTADGRIRWQRSTPGEPAKIRADSSLASSTPTTDGQAVYVSFWDGKSIFVVAYDFQGNVLWSKGLGTFNSQHGPGASPVLYKDKLFLANDMDKDDFDTKVPNARPSTLIALDKRTGRLLWETPRLAERACYSALFLRHPPGQMDPELVVTSSTAVTGYNVETGAKRWEAKAWQQHALKAPMRTVATPALTGDVLCVCSGGDAGRFAVALALPGAGSAEAPRRLWQNRKEFPYVPSPVARREHFYFVNDAGFAGCYQSHTGKRVWYERLGDAGFHASPVVIDGKIYAADLAGAVYVLAAEPTFRLLARNELGESVRATPAVADGRLYIRGERHLFCIGKTGGPDGHHDKVR
jgi:outer membrane protein assembly factor BamB